MWKTRKVNIAHTISLAFLKDLKVAAFLKDLKVAASPKRFISEAKFPKQEIQENHTYPLNSKKVRFFQCYYSQNSTKETESKAI